MSVFGGLGQFWWAVAALVGKNSCYGLGKFLVGMEQFGGLVVIDGQGKMLSVGAVFRGWRQFLWVGQVTANRPILS